MTEQFSRRQMLKVGMLGSGLSLSQYLRLQAESGKQDDNRSAVLVFLGGAPSHQDTFDLKPQAPAEYRGQFRPIARHRPVSRFANTCRSSPVARTISL